ncbi:MAG: 1-deoxy-D-xylulose-5-phosphate reductoisomerase [Bacteroidetes bacterium]|jgi:1-deoxy-D-xylulose-5-phosphate reductoisomerase|nr:1-deoxy-D-xylulose-5-phosphate reductoisomerase [Bacteroidota bacterium]
MTTPLSQDTSISAPRGLCILGSTGSIGTQTLDIVRLFPERFRVRALTAGSNADMLIEQARTFAPDCVVLADTSQLHVVEDALRDTGIEVLGGEDGLCAAATWEGVETVVAAVVGFAGLSPVLAAVRTGATVALANKETLVVAGALVNAQARAHGSTLIPVDSEHSAIFQCLVGEHPDAVESLTLTASGGPFRTRPRETFDRITPAEALDHPNWSMGAKITIDSATMMNKGLEVIEAHWLFDLAADAIDVLVHPQSIVHSLVTFVDGSTKAQLGVPDMKVPIQYALTYPDRWPAPHERLDWSTLSQLDFELPDLEKFPCLRLAYEALEAGGTAPAVLNAANEEAVRLFLEEQIRFTDIPRLLEDALGRLSESEAHSYDALVHADAAARRGVLEQARAVLD